MDLACGCHCENDGLAAVIGGNPAASFVADFCCGCHCENDGLAAGVIGAAMKFCPAADVGCCIILPPLGNFLDDGTGGEDVLCPKPVGGGPDDDNGG